MLVRFSEPLARAIFLVDSVTFQETEHIGNQLPGGLQLFVFVHAPNKSQEDPKVNSKITI